MATDTVTRKTHDDPEIPHVQQRVQRKVAGWYDRINSRWCYLFLLPAIVLSGLFTFYPMVMSWVYSFTQWTGFTSEMTFVGFDNYIESIQDPRFRNAFGRSMIFVLLGTPIRVILALAAALVLNKQVLRLSPAFRTMFFLPVMTAASVIGVVMQFVLSPNNGPVNTFLMTIGVAQEPVEFLSDPDLALWSVLAVHVWKNFGLTMIYWLAALQTVPQEYLEAGAIDGAGTWQLVRYISVPILIPFAVIIIVLTAKDNLHAFGIIQAMTGGGPFYRTEVIEVYIYRTAFQPDEGGVPRLGYASAAGCFFGTVTLIFALFQLWAAKRVAETRRALDTARTKESS